MVPVKDLVNAQFEGSLLESFKGKDSNGGCQQRWSYVSIALTAGARQDGLCACPSTNLIDIIASYNIIPVLILIFESSDEQGGHSQQS